MRFSWVLLVGLAVLSPLAFCCEGGRPVDAVLLGGSSVPISKRAQRQSNPDLGGGTLCGETFRPPVYPKDARAAHVQGHVIMEAVIDEKGSVGQLKVISGHPLLVNAAMEAVKEWKYKPYLVQGKAVPVKTTIDVNFSLSGG